MTRSRRTPWRFVVLLLCGVGGVGLLAATTTTRQGVDFTVSAIRVPVMIKALEFLDRDWQYGALARQITRGRRSEEERLLALFEWTRARIRPTPEGWPIIDDHILHIIIRGHGLTDQIADVFTTLATYAGLPAFWKAVKVPRSAYDLVLSFARVDGRWVVCDVWHGLLFKNAEGRLASVEELVAHRELVTTAAGGLLIGEQPYAHYFDYLLPLTVPDPLRAQLQMPWPRLRYEARRVLKREGPHDS